VFLLEASFGSVRGSARNSLRISRSADRVSRRHFPRAPPSGLGTPSLLRQWWKARRSRYDTAIPVQDRWLFPGNKRGKPMTTRQLSRLFQLRELRSLAALKPPPAEVMAVDGGGRRKAISEVARLRRSLPEPDPESHAAISLRSARPPIITVIGALPVGARLKRHRSVY
jgi:hypothetical protein